jgi:hypothetical protein
LSPQICAAWAAGIAKMPKGNKSARARGSRRTGRFGGWIVALATALPPDPSALPAQAQLPPTSDPGRARSWLRRPPGRAARPRTRCAPCFAPCSARPLATSRASYLRARHKVRVEQGGTGVARAESVTRSHLLGRSGRAWRGKGAPATCAQTRECTAFGLAAGETPTETWLRFTSPLRTREEPPVVPSGFVLRLCRAPCAGGSGSRGSPRPW